MVSVTECGISFVSFPLACTLLSICSASDVYFVIWYRFSDCKYSPNNICKCISLCVCVSVCVMCILILFMLILFGLVCFVLFICGFVLRSRFDLFQKRAAFNISVGFEWFNHIAKKNQHSCTYKHEKWAQVQCYRSWWPTLIFSHRSVPCACMAVLLNETWEREKRKRKSETKSLITIKSHEQKSSAEIKEQWMWTRIDTNCE